MHSIDMQKISGTGESLSFILVKKDEVYFFRYFFFPYEVEMRFFL